MDWADDTAYSLNDIVDGVNASFLNLEKLERWAESHPTHLRIFVTFFRVAAGLKKLRLYHEVSVSDAKSQVFEYINCHPHTGMLRDAVVAPT